jgi:hypothetical protein
LAPQGGGVAIDVVGGSNFQILFAGGGGQNQAAAQGYLLWGAVGCFPPNQLLEIVCG